MKDLKKKKKRNFPGLYAYQNVLLYTYLYYINLLLHTLKFYTTTCLELETLVF